MIGATLGAVIVSAIGFATDPTIGIACVVFYVVYQQVENYVIYLPATSRSADIPGSVTVIAALVGAALLGVVGALLAIPTAAAILLLTREVLVRRAGRALTAARLAELDGDHPGEDQHAADHLDPAGHLAEQQPRSASRATSTSDSAANDASREPSRRARRDAATYANAAVTTPSPRIGTHHDTAPFSKTTSRVEASNGTIPTGPPRAG